MAASAATWVLNRGGASAIRGQRRAAQARAAAGALAMERRQPCMEETP